MITHPVIKVLREEDGKLVSSFAEAPWAKRVYKPFEWNYDERGMWVYQMTNRDLRFLVTEMAGRAFQVWYCEGRDFIHPQWTDSALTPDSKKPDGELREARDCVAAKELYLAQCLYDSSSEEPLTVELLARKIANELSW